MQSKDIEDAICNFILTEVLNEPPAEPLQADHDLLERGIIDSMGALEIVGFMEQTYGFEVEDDEITLDNFRTLASMAGLVLTKLG